MTEVGGVRQLGFRAIVTHNPDMETCQCKDCDNVLFGEIYVMQFTIGEEVREYELCSLKCYQETDARIEAELTRCEDFIAVIDNGQPEEWK